MFTHSLIYTIVYGLANYQILKIKQSRYSFLKVFRPLQSPVLLFGQVTDEKLK